MSGLVVVTGGAAGIGRAVAARLASDLSVIIADRVPEVARAAAEIGVPGVEADLLTDEGVAAVVAVVAAADERASAASERSACVHARPSRCKLAAHASACFETKRAGTGLAPTRRLCYSQRLSLA